MIYYSICDISSVKYADVDKLREQIKSHFTERVNLKRKESVISKILLCYMLKKHFKIEDDFLIDCDENEKPYIIGTNVSFNISHSGNFVLCACSTVNVGCDVQEIKAYNDKVAKRFFTESEYALLSLSENKAESFTSLWALKESILKHSGEGISGGLDRFDFSDCLDLCRFKKYDLNFLLEKYNGVFIGVCSCEKQMQFSEVNIDELIHHV